MLDFIGEVFEAIVDDEKWPLEMRVFVFIKKVKNRIMHSGKLIKNYKINDGLLEKLITILQDINNGTDIRFKGYQLQELAKFVEKKYMLLNFKELMHMDSPSCLELAVL